MTSKPALRVQYREIALLSILAYAFGWLWWGTRILPKLGSADPLGSLGTMDIVIGDFGPLLGAVVMRLFVSREWLAIPVFTFTVLFLAFPLPGST